jgi:hypothetical protein
MKGYFFLKAAIIGFIAGVLRPLRARNLPSFLALAIISSRLVTKM